MNLFLAPCLFKSTANLTLEQSSAIETQRLLQRMEIQLDKAKAIINNRARHSA